MRGLPPVLILLLAAPVLQGCVAKAAIGVATAPVRAATQAADWATTSQDEADRARGREIRRREEALAELQDRYDDLAEDCEDGSDRACREAVTVRREIEASLPGVPLEAD